MAKMYSVEDVKEAVEMEGLAYAVMDYLSAEEIENRSLRELFKVARKALNDVEAFLEEDTGEEMDYG